MQKDELAYIERFIESQKYFISKTHNSRFMDQKCTPDVVNAVSECVLAYVKNKVSQEFTKNDIWHSSHANSLITGAFSKPNLSESSAKKEYEKFFSQPLKLLAVAGVLNEELKKGKNYYKINQLDVLKYIGQNELNAIHFMNLYLKKVLKDNELDSFFDIFFKKQDAATFIRMKRELDFFIHTKTQIQNDKEPSRIYNKIINILAFVKGTRGERNGALSENIITINDIRYNRENWRDSRKGKGKNITRQNYSVVDKKYYDRATKQMIDAVKKIHEFSEIHRFARYPATQAHHIFPKKEFPTLASVKENIICVTPNQHNLRCHPNNHTKEIDKEYQIICLLSKLDSIEYDFEKGTENYTLGEFTRVLNTGFKTEDFSEKMDFEEIKHQIIKHAQYNKDK